MWHGDSENRLDSDVAGDIKVGEKLPMKLFSNIMDSEKILLSALSDPIGVEGKEKDGNMPSSLVSMSSLLSPPP